MEKQPIGFWETTIIGGSEPGFHLQCHQYWHVKLTLTLSMFGSGNIKYHNNMHHYNSNIIMICINVRKYKGLVPET